MWVWLELRYAQSIGFRASDRSETRYRRLPPAHRTACELDAEAAARCVSMKTA
jgi:hypothetical protein